MPLANVRPITPLGRGHKALTWRHKERQRIEQEIESHLSAAERLIADLDRLDEDPELEPYLGALEQSTAARFSQEYWTEGPKDDREEDGGDCREIETDEEAAIQMAETVDLDLLRRGV